MRITSTRLLVISVVLLAACEAADLDVAPVFVSGKAVAPSGDSLLAIVPPDSPGVVVYDRRTGTRTTLGEDVLNSPAHLQWVDDRLYVA